MHLNVPDELKHGESTQKICHYILMKNLVLRGQSMPYCFPCISAFTFFFSLFFESLCWVIEKGFYETGCSHGIMDM